MGEGRPCVLSRGEILGAECKSCGHGYERHVSLKCKAHTDLLVNYTKESSFPTSEFVTTG